MTTDAPDESEPTLHAPWALNQSSRAADGEFLFTLSIARMSPGSQQALANLTALCERCLPGLAESPVQRDQVHSPPRSLKNRGGQLRARRRGRFLRA